MSVDSTSTVILVLRNSGLSNCDSLSVAVSQALRKYLDLVDSGYAGNESQEKYVCPDGTEVSITAVSSPVVDIPCAKPSVIVRPRSSVGVDPQPLVFVLAE